MNPTKYKTATGKDATIRIRKAGKNYGDVYSVLKVNGREVFVSPSFAEGRAEAAKRAAVNMLAAH